jgi:hypothetical protein
VRLFFSGRTSKKLTHLYVCVQAVQQRGHWAGCEAGLPHTALTRLHHSSHRGGGGPDGPGIPGKPIFFLLALKRQCHEIHRQVVLMNQYLPSPWVSHLGRFRIFSKIRGDVHSSRCTTGVVGTGGKWKKIFNQHIDKFFPSSSLQGVISLMFQLFATCVVDSGGKFTAGVVGIGG